MRESAGMRCGVACAGRGRQAALRRVATLVARGVAPEQAFTAVIEEADRLLSVEFAGLGRYAPDRTITMLPPGTGRANTCSLADGGASAGRRPRARSVASQLRICSHPGFRLWHWPPVRREHRAICGRLSTRSTSLDVST